MAAKRRNNVTRNLKAVRVEKSMPMQRIELSGSIHDIAKVLSDMGLKVPKSRVRARKGYKGVVVVKGVAGIDSCNLTDDITLVKATKIDKPNGAGKASAKVVMSNKKHG